MRQIKELFRTIICFFLFLFVIAIIGMVVDGSKTRKAEKYHAIMAVLEESGTPVTGEKMVSLVHNEYSRDNELIYSKEYIPAGYTTKTPQEVRYILHCTEGSYTYGIYSNGSSADIRWVEIEILDRQSGEIIVSKRFEGGLPPDTTTGGSTYGSKPSKREISEWILSETKGR